MRSYYPTRSQKAHNASAFLLVPLSAIILCVAKRRILLAPSCLLKACKDFKSKLVVLRSKT